MCTSLLVQNYNSLQEGTVRGWVDESKGTEKSGQECQSVDGRREAIEERIRTPWFNPRSLVSPSKPRRWGVERRKPGAGRDCPFMGTEFQFCKM